MASALLRHCIGHCDSTATSRSSSTAVAKTVLVKHGPHVPCLRACERAEPHWKRVAFEHICPNASLLCTCEGSLFDEDRNIKIEPSVWAAKGTHAPGRAGSPRIWRHSAALRCSTMSCRATFSIFCFSRAPSITDLWVGSCSACAVTHAPGSVRAYQPQRPRIHTRESDEISKLTRAPVSDGEEGLGAEEAFMGYMPREDRFVSFWKPSPVRAALLSGSSEGGSESAG